MQRGIVRSVQRDVCLVRVALHLLSDRSESDLCECGRRCKVSPPDAVTIIFHPLFVHFVFFGDTIRQMCFKDVDLKGH